MDWTNYFDSVDQPTGLVQSVAHERDIKNVVVQAAVLEVAQRAGVKLFERSRQRIAVQIVMGEYLLEVGQVRFRSLRGIVCLQVFDRGDWPAMVESAGGVGQEKDEVTARAHGASPLSQRGERIGGVLEAVRGNDKVVTGISDTREASGLAQVLPAGRLARLKAKFAPVAQVRLPRGLGGEVDIVDAVRARVHW